MPEPSYPRLLSCGDTAFTVEFGEEIDRAINAKVLALADRIAAAGIAGVVETVPTFRSLTVHCDPVTTSVGEVQTAITPLLEDLSAETKQKRLWVLPTYYGDELGPDLAEVADRTGMSAKEVIDLHAAETYHVYAIGFLPGWPYMGDVPDRLSLPRRESPRVRVPMGSVCIALKMTGVYPLESPGGWHLIGRTPVRMFDIRRREAVLLSPGDQVRYQPIDRHEYDRLEAMATAGELGISPQAVEP